MKTNQYHKIDKVLYALAKEHPVIKTGVQRNLQVFEEGSVAHKPAPKEQLMAFSKSTDREHAVVIYNASAADAQHERIALDKHFDNIDRLHPVYGYKHPCDIEVHHRKMNGSIQNYISLYLKPRQLVVLKD